MNAHGEIRVAVNGYGVIGKRVADAVVIQDDMVLASRTSAPTGGCAWSGTRLRAVRRDGRARGRHAPGRPRVEGSLDDLLDQAEIVVDCTPKRVAAKNVESYRRRGLKFIVQGGEQHAVTGHSFVAEASYASALDGAARAWSPATPPRSSGP